MVAVPYKEAADANARDKAKNKREEGRMIIRWLLAIVLLTLSRVKKLQLLSSKTHSTLRLAYLGFSPLEVACKFLPLLFLKKMYKR